MKVNIKIIPRPLSTSMTLFARIDKEKIRKDKSVIIKSEAVSKTRISTSISVGEATYLINFQIDGFKFAEVSDINYLYGERETHYYFKLLKSQGFDKYKEYLKKLVEYVLIAKIGVVMDEVTIKLYEPSWVDLNHK